MLMHTRGILVMTPDSAMVLTGKQALDYSGGVSAEDNFGIGGYERIMGPNGQAQYWAPTLRQACRDPACATTSTPTSRRASASRAGRHTDDPVDRDVRDSPAHAVAGSDFTAVGDIFSDERNPERKKPFDIRSVMRAVIDHDHPPLERWAAMARRRDGGRLGRAPRRLSRCACSASSRGRSPRRGHRARRRPDRVDLGHAVPAVVEEDRPGDQRRERQPAGRRAGQPVRLRRLAGVDARTGSSSTAPRSAGRSSTSTARSCSCVVSRYHGGAFVVFSKRLNEQHRGRGRRGLLRLGHRRRAGRRRGLRPRGRRPHRAGPAGREPAGAVGSRRRRAACAPRSHEDSRRRCDRRSWARSPTSSTASTASSGRCAVGLGRPDHPAQPTCARTSSTRSSAGWRQALLPGRVLQPAMRRLRLGQQWWVLQRRRGGQRFLGRNREDEVAEPAPPSGKLVPFGGADRQVVTTRRPRPWRLPRPTGCHGAGPS